MNTRISTALVCAASVFLSSAIYAGTSPSGDQLPVERYALYVACNDGGKDRETLRYAGSDATKLAKTMNEIGGIKQYNSMILIDPAKSDIDEAFATFTSTIERNKGRARRTEFVFYYSGHSDEKSFLLGSETYDYAELKTALGKVPSDVHVVMLDSCFSGNFVRTKGGSRQKPFLMDDSTVVQGHAYLASSSDKEASQESDSIKSSYFTHALISGLRGAADTSGDGKVSLNELYHYAFNETLSDTELSAVGPQHPSYNITLVGSGDLVLTDINDAESSLTLPADSEGKFFVRDINGLLVSEINKIKGTGVSLAIDSGLYTVVLVNAKATMQGTININRGERLILNPRDLSTVQKTSSRARGDAEEEEEPADADYVPLAVSLFPGMSYPAQQDNAKVSIGVFMASNENVRGVQANYFMGIINRKMEGIQGSGFMNISGEARGLQGAGFMNVAKGSVQGLQGAGFMNVASGPSQGLQGAGFMNVAKGGHQGLQGAGFANIASGDSEGLQAAGFMNIAGKMNGGQAAGFLNVADEVSFAQVGVINVARSNKGLAVGVLNFIADGIISPAVYMDSSGWAYAQYQGGTDHFFTTFLVGMNTDWCERWDYTNVVFGTGIGSRIQIVPNISIDVELLWKNVVDFAPAETFANTYTEEQLNSMTDAELEALGKDVGQAMDVGSMPSLRGTLNLSFAKHLSIFGAANLDARIHGFNDDVFKRGRYTMGSWEIARNRVTLYPTFSFGIKF